MKFEGIDLFCGAGGVTSGIEKAKHNRKKIARVIACINHDTIAIESHAANHKKVIHFTEDIKNFDVKKFPAFSQSADICTYLWASLECTNFSNAKGGLPRDADSRTLANHLFRYIEYLNPDYILIENVKEFMSWGDLDINGKPVSKDRGRLFLKWIRRVNTYGYECEYKILNAADFGAHTSRKRLFIIFAKHGYPIVWPEQTHCKNGDCYGLKKWNPVKEVLDFSDKGESIFTRKKPLSERTYRRIYAGLIKYVAGGEKAFITKWMGNNKYTGTNNGKSINDPCPVVTTQNRLGLVSIDEAFISRYYSSDGNPGSQNMSIEKPLGTITTIDHHSLVQPVFFVKYHGNSVTSGIDKPSPTLTTKDRLALIQSSFIDEQFGCSKGKSIEEPAGSILPNPKQNLITAQLIPEHFIDMHYKNGNPTSIEKPANVITTNPVHAMVTVDRSCVMTNQYNNVGRSLEEPAQTILASRHHHYLMNPQYYSKGSSVNDPCFTLIARMDKRPPYLVSTEEGNIAIEIYESDSPYIKKIKQFMALYGIVDIYMRMLQIKELLRIQGFDEGYKLKGNQSQQKKFIGNAVVPVIPKKIIEALYEANLALKQLPMEKVA